MRLLSEILHLKDLHISSNLEKYCLKWLEHLNKLLVCKMLVVSKRRSRFAHILHNSCKCSFGALPRIKNELLVQCTRTRIDSQVRYHQQENHILKKSWLILLIKQLAKPLEVVFPIKNQCIILLTVMNFIIILNFIHFLYIPNFFPKGPENAFVLSFPITSKAKEDQRIKCQIK